MAAKTFKSRKKYRSMRLAMLMAMIIAAALALVTFFSIELAANAYINNTYLSEQSKLEREKQYAEDLQRYVDENALSSLDLAQLAEWAQGNKYLYVMIHKDDKLLFETGRFEGSSGLDNNGQGTGGELGGENGENGDTGGTDGGDEGKSDATDTESGAGGTTDKDDDNSIGSGITVDLPTREELMQYAEGKEAHLITMSDAAVLVSMADFTEYFYYDLTNIAAMVLAFIVLVSVVLLYSHGVTGRISRIASDVALVAEGDMDHEIRPNGVDEIGRLSRDVENMRTTMLENIAKERELMDANTELVTSMSHDIRTPLTVLLGYLNVMKLHSPDEEMTRYITASEKTALRLKKLSDDMFSYFLLFGETSATVDMQDYDAYILIEQLISEHVLLLREQGYEVNSYSDSIRAGGTVITTDANLLKRIVENVMSNVSKYADKAHPVLLFATVSDGILTLCVENVPHESAMGVESNGIGLKTCRKLSSIIGARFDVEREENSFRSKLYINIKTEENE